MSTGKRATQLLIKQAGGSPSRLIALRALAQRLGVDRDTVAYWWRCGRIPRWWLEKVEELAGK